MEIKDGKIITTSFFTYFNFNVKYFYVFRIKKRMGATEPSALRVKVGHSPSTIAIDFQ